MANITFNTIISDPDLYEIAITQGWKPFVIIDGEEKTNPVTAIQYAVNFLASQTMAMLVHEIMYPKKEVLSPIDYQIESEETKLEIEKNSSIVING